MITGSVIIYNSRDRGSGFTEVVPPTAGLVVLGPTTRMVVLPSELVTGLLPTALVIVVILSTSRALRTCMSNCMELQFLV